MYSTGSPMPAWKKPWSTCITTPTRLSGILPVGSGRASWSPTTAANCWVPAAVKALPQLGDAPFFHVNSDTIWIDGVHGNLGRLAVAFDPDRMDALLLLAPTASSIG